MKLGSAKMNKKWLDVSILRAKNILRDIPVEVIWFNLVLFSSIISVMFPFIIFFARMGFHKRTVCCCGGIGIVCINHWSSSFLLLTLS